MEWANTNMDMGNIQEVWAHILRGTLTSKKSNFVSYNGVLYMSICET